MALGVACGDEPLEVPERDQRAIFRGCVEDAQPLFRQARRKRAAAGERRHLSAYATLLRIARRDPAAIIRSPDFVDVRWTAREYVAARGGDIAFCMDRSPRVDASWRRLRDRLDRGVAAMAIG